MKTIRIICIYLSFIFLLSGCGNFKNNSNNTEKPSDILNNNNSIVEINTENTDESNNLLDNNSDEKKEEIEIANFSTPLTSGSPNRIVNIKLTCNKINEYILKDGETFSFNQLVGPCTAEEGYLEAEIYVNKQIEYALGGGNCQVSTTLYNACLQVEGITIIERHEHGRDVDYIEDGKDATVSYNTLDYSFRNDTGYDIKLFASCDDVNVYASISKIQ